MMEEAQGWKGFWDVQEDRTGASLFNQGFRRNLDLGNSEFLPEDIKPRALDVKLEDEHKSLPFLYDPV